MQAVGRPAMAALARPLQPTVPGHGIQRAASPAPVAPPSPGSIAGGPRRDRAGCCRLHPCRARRRVRYDHGEGEEEEGEENGHNWDLAMIESYSQAARGVALLVRATVDAHQETVLVFKGFSSLLSSGTSSDPAKSVLPARAVIRSVDVVRGPFDPSNIEYLEKDLTWEAFKSRIQPN